MIAPPIRLTKEEQAVATRLLEIAAGKDSPDSGGMSTAGAIELYKQFCEAVKLRYDKLGDIT